MNVNVKKINHSIIIKIIIIIIITLAYQVDGHRNTLKLSSKVIAFTSFKVFL